MTSFKQTRAVFLNLDQVLGKHSFRQTFVQLVNEGAITPIELASRMHLGDADQVEADLSGVRTIPLSAALAIADEFKIERAQVIRSWLAETHPEVLEALDLLPAPVLISDSERRFLADLRSTAGRVGGSEFILTDSANVIGIVFARE